MANQDTSLPKKRSGSPAAQTKKKRAKPVSKVSPTNNDLITDSNSITQYPMPFRSDKGYECFTKNWWKEVTTRDDFWKELETNVPASIWKKRLVVRVMSGSTSDTSPPAQQKERIVEGDDTSNATYKGSFKCEKCSGIFEASAMANLELLGVLCGSCAAAGEILDREKPHETVIQEDSQVFSVQQKTTKEMKTPASHPITKANFDAVEEDTNTPPLREDILADTSKNT